MKSALEKIACLHASPDAACVMMGAWGAFVAHYLQAGLLWADCCARHPGVCDTPAHTC